MGTVLLFETAAGASTVEVAQWMCSKRQLARESVRIQNAGAARDTRALDLQWLDLQLSSDQIIRYAGGPCAHGSILTKVEPPH